MGTNEGGTYWDDCQFMYDVHLAQGHAANADVTFVPGCGHAHNEPAWAARLPHALRYLLPVREEPAELAQREAPPRIVINEVRVPDPSIVFEYTSLFGFSYTLRRTENFVEWTPVATAPAETLPWATRTIGESQFPMSARYFWRVEATPAP